MTYTAFLAGPAAVICGYQNLIKLTGKDPNDSFPEATWQFYADYALREDAARHTNETYGFDTTLEQHQMVLDPVDRVTAWVMAAIYCLHQYNDLLENEWRERVYTHLLREVTRDGPDAERYARIYDDWQAERPYGRGADAGAAEDYPTYRRHKFDRFLDEAMQDLDRDRTRQWTARVRAAERLDLPAYQRQMSILAYLKPGAYGEVRTPIPLEEAAVGLIYWGRYYLIAACSPGTDRPADVSTVRAQVAALMANTPTLPPARLAPWVGAKRTATARLREQVSPELVAELDAMRLAPILINGDPRPPGLPLSELRQAERGAGDHALTILNTGKTLALNPRLSIWYRVSSITARRMTTFSPWLVGNVDTRR